MILKSNKLVVIIEVLIFINRVRFEIIFLQYFNCVMYGNLTDFEIEQTRFFFKLLILLIGSASKSNFWQYLNYVIKGNLVDFEIGKNSFYMFLLRF